MKKKDSQLPLDQHQEIGEKLKEIKVYLTHLSVTLANTYTREKGYKVLNRLGKVTNAIDELRNELDGQVFKEYPNEENLKGIY